MSSKTYNTQQLISIELYKEEFATDIEWLPERPKTWWRVSRSAGYYYMGDRHSKVRSQLYRHAGKTVISRAYVELIFTGNHNKVTKYFDSYEEAEKYKADFIRDHIEYKNRYTI